MVSRICNNMEKPAMYYFGKALQSYYQGEHNTTVIIERDDGYRNEHSIAYYFRNPSNFSEIEKLALNLCYGKVLDLGAGAGTHSLELQQRGLDVVALDICPEACDIMKKRGVDQVICSDFWNHAREKYDTILSLGRSLGFVGTIEGFLKFLNVARHFLTQGGQLIFDFGDIRLTKESIHLNYQELNKLKQQYIGEIRFYIEFKGKKGRLFQMLQLDPDKLAECCIEADYSLNFIRHQEDGNYLAQLTPN